MIMRKGLIKKIVKYFIKIRWVELQNPSFSGIKNDILNGFTCPSANGYSFGLYIGKYFSGGLYKSEMLEILKNLKQYYKNLVRS